MRGSTSGINRRASRSPPRLPGPQPRLRFAGSADPAMGFASFRFRGHLCSALGRARPRSNHRPPQFRIVTTLSRQDDLTAIRSWALRCALSSSERCIAAVANDIPAIAALQRFEGADALPFRLNGKPDRQPV